MSKTIEEQVEAIQAIMKTSKKKPTPKKKKEAEPKDNIDANALPESLKHLVKQ